MSDCKRRSIDTVAWRLAELYNLTGELCNGCGTLLFPPRDVCPECVKGSLEAELNIAREIKNQGGESFQPYTVRLRKEG